jgi:hypothetical protein|tara:strand:+ start:2026 stop:2271 length:246 start_codon:yes stop_codon:yes gene_type:complete
MIKINDSEYVNPDNINKVDTKNKLIEMKEGHLEIQYTIPFHQLRAEIIKWKRECNVKPFDIADNDKEQSQYNREGYKHDIR